MASCSEESKLQNSENKVFIKKGRRGTESA
jgi:hypothetical protein